MHEARIRAQARALAQLAVALTSVTRDETNTTSELPTHDLGHAIARLAVTLNRVAQPWDLTDGADEADQVLLGERPFADTQAAFLFGSQILDCFARVELARRDDPPPHTWKALVKHVDDHPWDPMTPGVRYLNVALGFGRDLVIEHYAADQYPGASYSGGADITLSRIAPADEAGEPYGSAVALLRDALGAPANSGASPAAEYHELADRAMEAAPALDFRRAGLVRQAFRLAGGRTAPLPWIIDWLLAVLREHAKARGIKVGGS